MKSTGSYNLTNLRADNSCATIKTISSEACFEKTCRNQDLKEPIWKCCYVVTIVGFLAALSESVQMTIMSVAIVSMVNNTAIIRNSKAKSESCVELLLNSTGETTAHDLTKTYGEFVWSPEIQGYILGSYFFGYVISKIPSGRLAERYGCKWILVGSLAATSILTVLVPPFSWLSASALIVLQTVRGIAQGAPGSCTATLITNWSPNTHRGFFYSIITSAYSLGPALANIFTGYLSEAGLWPYSFYSIGCSGVVLAVYIAFFIAENPTEHPKISRYELNFILSAQENILSRRRPKLPVREMLTTVPLYAMLFATFGRLWKSSQFQIVHSTYMGTILHYPSGQNGLFTAIPFLASFLTSMLASWISGHMEKKKIVSVDFLRKFWNFLSCSLYSLCLLGMYIAGCDRSLSVIFAILSMASAGLGLPGSSVVVQDMAPTFSGTLSSLSYTAASLSFLLLPITVGYLTEQMQTLEQWNKVFFITIGVVMSSSILFVIFGSAKLQPWNFVEEENHKTNEKQPKNDGNDEAQRY